LENPIDNYDVMVKELELIQKIIERFSRNSFLIKGWAVTLVVATLLLKTNDITILIAFLPLFVFWYLDAYFLHHERLYRKLHKWVIKHRMNSLNHMLDMSTMRVKQEKKWQVQRTMFSKTLIFFYGSIFILIIAYLIILTLSQILMQ